MKRTFTYLLLLFAVLLTATVHAQSDMAAGMQGQTDCRPFAPNAFTPNGDGTNDEFYIKMNASCSCSTFNLKIYDRWGRLVFNSYSPDQRWDGSYDGDPLKDGTYIWKLTATLQKPDDNTVTRIDEKGTLVLLR